jgi:hypothetical protein
MAFDPSVKYECRTATLPLPWPGYIHPHMRDRIKSALEHGHWCRSAGPVIAALRIRATPHEAVWLQCLGCGGSIGSAMSKKEHPAWQGYGKWDASIAEAYQEAKEAYYEELAPPTIETRIQAFRHRQQEYREWCRTSPEWAQAKDRVLWRSRGFCEACLIERASTVHHLTYNHGKIPPAWELRAVCHQCHQRLHNGDDEWCDWGMAK